MKLLCRQPPCRLAPAPVIQCPRQELNLVFDLRTVACKSATLRGHVSFSAPPRNRTPSLQIRSLPCDPAHSQGKCLDQESNLDLDLRRVLCDPLHHRDIQRPDLESNQGQGLRRAPCDPLHHRDGHIRADDWICTSMMRFTKPPPRCSATSAISSRSARSRTPLGGFGGRFLSQEDTPVSAPGLATGGSWRNNYSRSVTFQYASLMNFDQLSIRTSWSA